MSKAVAVVPCCWWQRTVDYCPRTSSLNIWAVRLIICVYKTSDKRFVKERLALSVTVFKGTKRLLSRAMLQSMATPSYPQPVYSCFMRHWSIFLGCRCQFLARRLCWIIEECISAPVAWIYSPADSLSTALVKVRPCSYKHTTWLRSHGTQSQQECTLLKQPAGLQKQNGIFTEGKNAMKVSKMGKILQKPCPGFTGHQLIQFSRSTQFFFLFPQQGRRL